MDNEDVLDTDFWRIFGVLLLFQVVFSNGGAVIISFFLGFFGLMSLIPVFGFIFSVAFVYISAGFAVKFISKKFKISVWKIKYILTFYTAFMIIISLFCTYILEISIMIQTGLFVFTSYKKFKTILEKSKNIPDTMVTT